VNRKFEIAPKICATYYKIRKESNSIPSGKNSLSLNIWKFQKLELKKKLNNKINKLCSFELENHPMG
jgi:hypothetical protein